MKPMREKMDWFSLWCEDKESIIATMRKNMADDLAVGYNPNGMCIMRQRVMIEDYQKQFDHEMEMFKYWDMPKVQHWCHIDLKKRGAIS